MHPPGMYEVWGYGEGRIGGPYWCRRMNFAKTWCRLWRFLDLSQSTLSTRSGSGKQYLKIKNDIIQTLFFLLLHKHTHFTPHIKRRIPSKFGDKQIIFKGGAEID